MKTYFKIGIKINHKNRHFYEMRMYEKKKSQKATKISGLKVKGHGANFFFSFNIFVYFKIFIYFAVYLIYKAVLISAV